MPDGIIVFYSWIGSTRVAAEEIGKLTGFPLSEIREAKERGKGRIMSAAMAAMTGLKSRILPQKVSLAPFSDVILGTPVWAGKTPPAVNAFLAGADLKGKRVWLFITQSDVDAPSKAAESVTRRVQARGGRVAGVVRFRTAWDPKTNVPVSAAEIRGPVRAWTGEIIPGMAGV